MLNDDKITSLKENKSYKFNNSKSLSLGHKILTGLMAVSMLFSFVGCGNKENKPDTPVNPNPPVIEPVDPVDPVNPNPPVVDPEPENPNPPVDPDPDKPNPPVDPDPEKPNPPVEVKFDKNNPEHVAKLMENLQPTIELINIRAGNTEPMKEVKRIYLAKSDGANIIDSIGGVFINKKGSGEDFYMVELKLPVTQDLTYEDIFNNGLSYSQRKTSLKALFSINAAKSQEEEFKSTADIILNQAFELNNKIPDWSCWNVNPDMTIDVHTVVILKDNEIIEKQYNIYHEYGVSMVNAVKQNFEGKTPSESTYTLRSEKTVTFAEDALNIPKLLQKADAEVEI